MNESLVCETQITLRKRCVFCGSKAAKISNDHARLAELDSSALAGKGFDNHRYTSKEPITFPGRYDDMGVKVGALCKPCNEGWMERLER